MRWAAKTWLRITSTKGIGVAVDAPTQSAKVAGRRRPDDEAAGAGRTWQKEHGPAAWALHDRAQIGYEGTGG